MIKYFKNDINYFFNMKHIKDAYVKVYSFSLHSTLSTIALHITHTHTYTHTNNSIVAQFCGAFTITPIKNLALYTIFLDGLRLKDRRGRERTYLSNCSTSDKSKYAYTSIYYI